VSKHVETVLLIRLGSIIGANLRYRASGWVAEWPGRAAPGKTFFVNVSSSCLLAAFIPRVSGHVLLSLRLRLFLEASFFGAYAAFLPTRLKGLFCCHVAQET